MNKIKKLIEKLIEKFKIKKKTPQDNTNYPLW
jgi:hypothetical protein